jgi:hypothetical protein
MGALDIFLLDHAFQPIVNWMLKHPCDVAVNAAIGSTVMAIAPILYWLNLRGWTDWGFNLFLIIEDFSIFGMFWFFTHIARRTIKPGYANPFRYLLVTARVTMLILIPVSTVISGYIDVVSDMLNPISGMSLLANPLRLCVFYFVSCEYPTPKPRRLLAPA